MKKITTVSIVDDEPDLREHIAGYLAAAGDVRCKSAYASAEEALQHLPEDKPDVILMDINLGGMPLLKCSMAARPCPLLSPARSSSHSNAPGVPRMNRPRSHSESFP